MVRHEFTFTRDRQVVQVVQRYLNPLPRSIVRPREYVLLDGVWDFDLDLNDRGLEEKWYLGHAYTDVAHWPESIEGHMIGADHVHDLADDWQDRIVAWYEREFVVPDEWLTAPDHEVQVTFGACGYETRVWLNGHLLKTLESEEIHYGEYTHFSFELPTDYLLPVNRLTVRVADSLDDAYPRGKQESRVYKRGGIWYHSWSGPVRSVWIEPLERNRLCSRLSVSSVIEDRLVEFAFTTRVHDPGIYTLRLVITPERSDQPIAVSEVELPLEAGDKVQRIVVEMAGAELWTPQNPVLYHLVAQLTGPTGSVSQIESHFGLRKIEARGRRLYLNNEPIYLDGILYQPGMASFDQITRHMQAMKDLGCNLVRVHIAGIDPRIYDLADEMGMMLWVEVPSPHSSNQRSRANHRAELLRMLVIIGSHPSIVMCSLYNEDWGAQDIASSEETRSYIAELYTLMRLNYPQMLVVDNDGWHHVSVEGKLASSLLTAHLYTPDHAHWCNLLDLLCGGNNEGVAAESLVVGDPFFYCGQVPLLVSEWGGFGFSDYGGPEDTEAKTERIRLFKRELRERGIAGDVYTQATSIEDEVNGVIEPETADLLVPKGLLNSSIFAPQANQGSWPGELEAERKAAGK